MQCSHEIRSWLNILRSQCGKRNGVIKGYCLDDWRMEVKHITSKKNYVRHREKLVEA